MAYDPEIDTRRLGDADFQAWRNHVYDVAEDNPFVQRDLEDIVSVLDRVIDNLTSDPGHIDVTLPPAIEALPGCYFRRGVRRAAIDGARTGVLYSVAEELIIDNRAEITHHFAVFFCDGIYHFGQNHSFADTEALEADDTIDIDGNSLAPTNWDIDAFWSSVFSLSKSSLYTE